MSAGYRTVRPTIAMTSAVSVAEDDSRVIFACALSSVAMVCLAAAILYFRITVLRRERTLSELRRLEALAQRHPGRSNLSDRRGITNSRPVSRTPSSVSQRSLSRSWPSGSFLRQFSHPPRSPQSELRRGSLHAIPNGFGLKATVEPLAVFCDLYSATGTAQITSTKPERTSSLPDDKTPKPGDPRRASWSFENPVFDQWVPPLMMTELDDDNDDDDKDMDVFSPADDAVAIRHDISVTVIDSGDGATLVAAKTEQQQEGVSPQLTRNIKQAKLSRLAGYCGNPLYIDHPLSMPTLHEREDSSNSSGGGGNEKTTEAEATKGTDPDPNSAQRDGTTVITISQRRSESSC